MTRDEVSDNQLGKVIKLCLKQTRRSLGKRRGRTQDAWHKRSNILQSADTEHCVKTRL